MKDNQLKECISDFELLNGELVKNCESVDILSDDVPELDYYKVFIAVLLNRLRKFRADLFENKKYVSTADLIDEIMNVLKVSGGGIVPVTVGISKGSRVDYLYDYLPLLLSAILDEGYKVIPVKYLQQ